MKLLRAPFMNMNFILGAFLFFTVLSTMLFYSSRLLGQNLIPNPGFEDLFINEEFQWIQPINQWYHWERDEAGLGFAHGGEFFNGICMYNWHHCEYFHIKLHEPLKKDSTYHLSMWYRLAKFKSRGHHYLSKIGWYFEEKSRDTRRLQLLKEMPQASFQIPDSVNKTDWNLASTTYTASGNEYYLTIGYFPSMFWEEEEQMDFTKKEDSTLVALANKSKGKSKKKKKKKQKYNEKDLAEFRKLINEKYKMEQAVLKPATVEGNFTLRYYFDDFCIAKIDSLDSFDCTPKKSEVAIEAGQKFRLNRIYFESGLATLLDSSFYELNRLVFFLGLKPDININIIGHTDNEGDERDNLILSRDRAKAVRDYLISKNVSEDRLDSEGMGESQPIADNETEEGKQINRRVEFEITE